MLLQAIEEAIAYARAHLGLGELDAIYKRNLLLHYLGLNKRYGSVSASDRKQPDLQKTQKKL